MYATIHISERSGSGPARAPGRSWTSGESHQRNRDSSHPRQHFGNARQANVAEKQQHQQMHQPPSTAAEDDEYDESAQDEKQDAGDDAGDDDIDPSDIQHYIRNELEVLASGIEDDNLPPGVDSQQLEAACLKLAQLPEALAIVRAVRRGGKGGSKGTKSRGRGRSFSRGGGKNRGDDRSRSSHGKGGDRGGRPAQVGRQCTRAGLGGAGHSSSGSALQAKIDRRKATSTCNDCH